MLQVSEQYCNASLCWVQEEHKNMGAWSYVQPRTQTAIGGYHRYYTDITDFYSHCLVFSVVWHDLCNGDDHLMIAMKNNADGVSVNVVCGVNIMSSCSMFAVVLILTPHSHKHSSCCICLESKHK